jgi:bifunctional non-homologous end joining protein LigD
MLARICVISHSWTGTAALAHLLRDAKAGILLNEHIVEDGPIVFAHACQLGAEGIVSKKVDGTYRSCPCRVWIKVRNRAVGAG